MAWFNMYIVDFQVHSNCSASVLFPFPFLLEQSPCLLINFFLAFLLGSGTSFPHLCWLSDFFRLIQWHRLLISSKTCWKIPALGSEYHPRWNTTMAGSISVKRCKDHNVVACFFRLVVWHIFYPFSWEFFMILNWLSYFFRGVGIPRYTTIQ